MKTNSTSSTTTTTDPILTDLQARLGELGFIEGQDYHAQTIFQDQTLESLYPEYVEEFNATRKTNYANLANECCFYCDPYWYHPDYLGSVAMVTNHEGVVHQVFFTNAWGEKFSTYDNLNTGSFNSPYRFNGKEFDQETGLAYYGARYYDNKISIWLSVDALAMSPHSMPLTPYHFSANNPIANIDPDGNDWFENAETCQLIWLKDDVDVYQNDYGTWNNIGTELIQFDGRHLTYYTQGTTEEGKMYLQIHRFDARSGREQDGKFEYTEEAQARPDKGPLPEGDYSINPGRIQWTGDRNAIDKFNGRFGRGTFPGGEDSWGPGRVWLTPAEVQVKDPSSGEMVTRGGFTIHGGSEFGSAGCIDLGPGAQKFLDILSTSELSNIPVRVKYKRKSQDAL